MGSVNKVILVGNLGRDAELRYTPGGAAVATLNLATTEVWNDRNNQRQEKPEWRSTVVFDAQAKGLDGVLRKGVSVDVVAYEHRKVSKDPKTGKRRDRAEYYATAVTPKGRRTAEAAMSEPTTPTRHENP